MDMGEPNADAPGGSQAVRRAFELLELMARRAEGVSVSELADATGMATTTAHRIVSTLVAGGQATHNADRTYTLGPRLIQLGRTASTLLPHWTHPILSDLMEQFGETANLAVLDADDVVYVDQARSARGLQLFTVPNERLPAHNTAAGKVLMSLLPDDYVADVLRRTGMAATTPFTITELDEFLRQLATIRARGYAVDEQEQEVGVSCVAVPAIGAPRNMALSLTGPVERMRDLGYEPMARALVEAADRVVAQLGHV